MERRVLFALNKTLKRKHDESDLSEESVSPISSTDQDDAEGTPEISDRAGMKAPGAHLHGNVASKFQDLDIQCQTTKSEGFRSHSPTRHDIQSRKPELPLEPSTDGQNSIINNDSDDLKRTGSTVGPLISSNKGFPEVADPLHLGSPPPTFNETTDTEANEESLTWDDSEITGHHALDPNDDGYGLNGVGFKPSAEVAWARSQHRKDQVAEWKRRMASEAREARSRRRQKDDDSGDPIAKGFPKQKRVKFDA
ncbi:hypothetical protein MGYG_00570 [Nannizzia gypsea CBS 118893]|uniref:Uncharacterized protein n=1 Tax=Arthroderma gypseum (strain ATCC MYA-4604 / CBS 118893) TaxID=535722 RepID=E5R0H0_ARTGP|nr:hypothetical protein MGYG_00570 [Nannizzia gypsea CBS 118893]EFQ97529.1 hypothetical protein MGYG_00570 [Nannizzia gypsea CBS 118893]